MGEGQKETIFPCLLSDPAPVRALQPTELTYQLVCGLVPQHKVVDMAQDVDPCVSEVVLDLLH